MPWRRSIRGNSNTTVPEPHPSLCPPPALRRRMHIFFPSPYLGKEKKIWGRYFGLRQGARRRDTSGTRVTNQNGFSQGMHSCNPSNLDHKIQNRSRTADERTSSLRKRRKREDKQEDAKESWSDQDERKSERKSSNERTRPKKSAPERICRPVRWRWQLSGSLFLLIASLACSCNCSCLFYT